MPEKITLEKANEKLKKGIDDFNKQSNIGKLIIVVAILIILILLLMYSNTLFFFGAGIWGLYCWGKWVRTPKEIVKTIF